MIRDQILGNEKIQPNSKEIETLKANFPQFFDESGQFLQDRFMGMLRSNEVVLLKEGYELKFLGKSYARYHSSTATETFLAPLEEDNAKPENKDSENLYMIGDNLDALKHLINSYAGKIKCIYIDPPYNTGSDGFVYPDNFKFNVKELAQAIGIEEEEADRILNLAGKSSHSAWLTFMYPRLILARELLSDNGVIFTSIDDNEITNLKLSFDELFGEENFKGQISVVNNPRGRDYGGIAQMHEYLLVYQKSPSTEINDLENPEKKFPYEDEYGGYELRELRNRNIAFHKGNRPNLHYAFYINQDKELDNGLLEISLEQTSEHSIELYPKESQGYQTVWRWGKEKSKINLNREIAAKQMGDGGYMIVEKYRKSSRMARSIWGDKEDNSEKGTLLVKELFDGRKYFDFPKSMEMIKKIIQMGTSNSDIVLDFFSGSATTAHAVMQLNAEDGGNRKYIMVQLPEVIKEDKPAYQAGYRTIDEIGRERIKRAAKKIKEETGADIDYGFKTFKLESVNQNTLNKMIDFNPGEMLLTEDMVSVFDTDKASGKNAILATWLSEDGYGLTAEATIYSLNTFEADLYQDSLYIIKEGLGSEDVMELVKRLETMELDINRIVIYPYSIGFSVMHELKKNIKNLRNNKSVEVIERY